MYGPRATQVARTLGALSALGWESTVVCLDPRRGGPHWRDGRDVALPPGIGTIRVRSPQESPFVRAAWRLMPGLRERPDPQWLWIAPAARAAVDAASRTRFDVLVSFAQPWSDHLVGLRVRRETKLPWIAHFSDPWVDSPYWTGSAAQRAAAEEMEASVIREADAVVFVTQQAAELVMKKYPRELQDKVAVVPHGYVTPALNGPAHDSQAASRPLRLVYTGRFYGGLRTPDALLRAIAAMNAGDAMRDRLEVTFVGPFVTPFERAARSLGLDRLVRFRDRVPAGEAEALAADADVLLVIDAPTDGPSPFLPSKLVDYLPLRKPILGLTPLEGASAALLRRLGGLVAAPGDEAGIRAALTDLLRRWRDGTLAVGAEFERVASEYEIGRTTAAFSEVLARVSDGVSRP